MKLCFRKKRGLCTLLLILCCGSSWSLSQRHGGSARQTDRFCLREDFHQLWKQPTTNVCCKYDHVDKKETEEKQNRDDTVLLPNSEMNGSVVRSDLKDDVADRQPEEVVVTQLEPTLAISRDHEKYHGDDVRNSSENATQTEDSTEHPQQEQAADLGNNQTLMESNHEQNETDNATASILNDSIIQEAMPSFDEWKRIRLEEEMREPAQAIPKEPENRERAVKPPERKRGRRNYASMECGAKLVAANPSAQSASKVLVEAKDEYMLNRCDSLQKGGMWFIVELCESVTPTHIELANFELYSSTGKEFVVYMSDHYQSREWAEVGRFEMAHLKTVQTFPLDAPGFGKVIKVEFLSIYDKNQYYCPLSLVRVFGSSMVDDYEEKVNEVVQGIPEPLPDPVHVDPTPSTTQTAKKNVISQFVDNVMSTVRSVIEDQRPSSPDANCSDCSTNDTDEEVLPLEQQFGNCFELTNLSGSEGHLWPSMKCRFAQAANVQRSCRPLPATPSFRISPSPFSLVSDLSPSVSSVPSSATAAPSITMTAHLISPTSVAEAEKTEELKMQTKVVSGELNAVTKNETPQAQPSATQSAEAAADPAASVNQAKPNGKTTPGSNVNPVSPPPQPTPGNNPKENLFSRFENRIKKLELHMNLSGTYLQELSKRYRNQMEEMQSAFNKTVAALNMEAKKGLERDHNQQQALAVLQEKLTAATESLRKLEIESDSLWWRLLLAYLGLLAVSIAIVVVLTRLICQRSMRAPIGPQDVERQVLEILERELKSRLQIPKETKEKVQQPEQDKEQIEAETKVEETTPEVVNKIEAPEHESKPIKLEPSSHVKPEPVEVKVEPPVEPCSTEEKQQVDTEPFQNVPQKISLEEHRRVSEGDLSTSPAPFVLSASLSDETPLQNCRKCALSCCTHALLRH